MIALGLALVLTAAPAPCRAGSLVAGAFLQGATGSLAGRLDVTNGGPGRCTLPERPFVRLTWNGETLGVRREPLGGIRLPVLKPGARALASLRWRNWCGASPWGTLFRPRLLVSWPGSRGTIRVELHEPVTAPRCESPGFPSTLGVGRFRAGR